MSNLVIVESPGKVATISKYLNHSALLKKYGKFVVMASVGHIRDLAKKRLAIDVEHDFEPEYEFLADKKKVIENLQEASKKAKVVWLAVDADLEATFIAESIRLALGLGENYHRIVFTEITPSALEHAIQHPVRIDKNGLDSQACRRILDRLVGFKLSPLLWTKFNAGTVTLSAGRVQSALMHLIIAREKEIEAFESAPYWHVAGDFELGVGKEKTPLEDIRMYEKGAIWKTEEPKQVVKLFRALKGKWAIHEVKSRVKKENPDAPFITSSLQQEGSAKLKIGVKRVMQLAQGLYEAGHITYMRTDSYNMSEDFKAAGREYILGKWGETYYEGGVLRKKTVKGAQEAHECIRPTRASVEEIQGMSAEHAALYQLIWKRSIAFLMKAAVYDELEIKFRDAGMGEKEFVTSFRRVKFNGYLAVYGISCDSGDHVELMHALNEGRYKLAMQALYGKNTYTSPPARYNDAGLVKLMEQNGIGRPSTMVATIDKLYEKSYILKTDIQPSLRDTLEYEYRAGVIKELKGKAEVGGEKSKVKPTDIGQMIDQYLASHFDYIVDKNFTALMEADLDKIAAGQKKRLDVLRSFWGRFSSDLLKETAHKVVKTKIAAESKKIVVQGIEYGLRLAKYGPVVEYVKEGKKAYIGLKSYMKLTKKEYLDIDESDIEFLLSLPKKVGIYDGHDVMLHLGPYGLYLQCNGQNHKVFVKKFEVDMKLTAAQIKTFIERKIVKA